MRWAAAAGALCGLAALTRNTGVLVLVVVALGVWTMRPRLRSEGAGRAGNGGGLRRARDPAVDPAQRRRVRAVHTLDDERGSERRWGLQPGVVRRRRQPRGLALHAAGPRVQGALRRPRPRRGGRRPGPARKNSGASRGNIPAMSPRCLPGTCCASSRSPAVRSSICTATPSSRPRAGAAQTQRSGSGSPSPRLLGAARASSLIVRSGEGAVHPPAPGARRASPEAPYSRSLPILMLIATVPIGGLPRYRIPIDPFLIILAAIGAVWLWDRSAGRRPGSAG